MDITTPGQFITKDDFMRGHGTFINNGKLMSSVIGQVQKTNKLITVRNLFGRYTPQIGDLVIGEIISIGNKRWNVDINARQDGVLLLSSINLPGGILRRKVESDELAMREFFVEHEWLVAEVIQTNPASLHTRSLKGKLVGGRVLKVNHQLIRRQKSQIHDLDVGGNTVQVMLGVNGYIHISSDDVDSVNRMATCIECLNDGYVAIDDGNIMQSIELSYGMKPESLIEVEERMKLADQVRFADS